MISRGRACLPFLLPLGLTLMLLLVVRFAERERESWEQRRLEATLRQEAIRRAEALRAGLPFEAQVVRRNSRFQRLLQQALADQARAARAARAWPARQEPPPETRGQLAGGHLPALGEAFARAFTTAFPPAFRPAGTLVYAFQARADGSWLPLEGPGLTTTKGRMMADLFRWFAAASTLSRDERRRAEKRCLGVFGELCPFALAAGYRQGRVTVARYDGARRFLLWDTVTRGGRPRLGYFVLFPQRTPTLVRPRWRALHARVPGCRFPATPCYVPLDNAPAHLRPVFPQGARPSPALRRLLRQARLAADRERLLPFGKLVRIADGYAIREFLSLNASFELWLHFPLTGTAPPAERAVPLSAWLSGGLGFFWGLLLARTLIFGRTVSLPLRLWFPGFLALVGALPLSALFLVGSMQIGISEMREVQATLDQAIAHLEEIDSGNGTLILHFVDICHRLTAHATLPARLLESMATDFGRAADQVRALFQQHGLDLTDLSFLPLDDQPRIRTWTTAFGANRQGFITNLFRSLRDSLLTVLGIPLPTGKGGAGSDTMTLVSQYMAAAGLLMIEGKDTADSLYLTSNQGAYVALAGTPLLHFSEMLAPGGEIRGLLSLLADPTSAFDRRLTRICRQFRQGADPWHWLIFGRGSVRGFQPTYHGLEEKFWHTSQGRTMRWLMETTTRTHSPQTLVTEEAVFAAIPCHSAENLYLGTSRPLREIRALAAHRRFLLANLTVLIGLVILVLGLASGRHLVAPLQEVERGLRQVAEGRLDVRVGLAREDELGQVTRSFDRMIEGLQKRRELGQFVSATLEASLESSLEDQGPAGPEGPARIRSGAVLVCDLRGFTTLSEIHPPEQVVAMLNAHLDAMSAAIRTAGGLIETFIGDAIVAVFTDEEPGSGLERALRAASEMRRRHQALQLTRRQMGAFPYEMGIGIDGGEILTGTLSSAGRAVHAVLGPVRREAERLEGLSRRGSRTRIVVSPVVVGWLAAHHPDLELVPVPGTIGARELGHLLPAAAGGAA
ncbi:MAG: Adenylate cyclase [Candidatus Ozemobacter sibiricus]|jgi:class 3 adenylate cyclase|uniref:Adenylate cyclase n=1 Tax=Candidatus Ozemobacter sibiricus TaxID=2268124 RepID=A0A367ZT01_9BACT|nr:MAG: Adenylate cyclase [Candidatus Ozemobacter sibiricus]